MSGILPLSDRRVSPKEKASFPSAQRPVQKSLSRLIGIHPVQAPTPQHGQKEKERKERRRRATRTAARPLKKEREIRCMRLLRQPHLLLKRLLLPRLRLSRHRALNGQRMSGTKTVGGMALGQSSRNRSRFPTALRPDTVWMLYNQRERSVWQIIQPT